MPHSTPILLRRRVCDTHPLGLKPHSVLQRLGLLRGSHCPRRSKSLLIGSRLHCSSSALCDYLSPGHAKPFVVLGCLCCDRCAERSANPGLLLEGRHVLPVSHDRFLLPLLCMFANVSWGDVLCFLTSAIRNLISSASGVRPSVAATVCVEPTLCVF